MSGLTCEKNEAMEATRRMEVKMNQAMHQAKLQQKEKYMEVLSQSHSRFNRLMEVSGYKAFRLGWEQALVEPLAHVFVGLDDNDAPNHIENKNYDLEYYVSKENLNATFVEELEDETKSQGGRL